MVRGGTNCGVDGGAADGNTVGVGVDGGADGSGTLSQKQGRFPKVKGRKSPGGKLYR